MIAQPPIPPSAVLVTIAPTVGPMVRHTETTHASFMRNLPGRYANDAVMVVMHHRMRTFVIIISSGDTRWSVLIAAAVAIGAGH